MVLATNYGSLPLGESILAQFEIFNTGEQVEDWEGILVLDFPIREVDDNYEILGADVLDFEVTANGTYRYVIEPESYNEKLENGDRRLISFVGEYSEGTNPELLSSEVREENPEVNEDRELSISYETDFLYWSHNSGSTVYVTATNDSNSAIANPVVSFNSDFQIRGLLTDIWHSEVISESGSAGNYTYTIRLADDLFEPGESLDFGFNTLDPDPVISFSGEIDSDIDDGENDPDDGIDDIDDEIDQPDNGTDDTDDEIDQPINGSDGTVARPSWNQSTGFFVLDGKIYDANGNEFVARGVNNMHVWYDTSNNQPARGALDNIADAGFNSVRIAWDTDFSGHGDFPHDSILESIIETSIDNSLVPMVELHDWTGSNDVNDMLNRGVTWWTDRAHIWQQHEESLMINIFNEAGDYNFGRGESRAEFPRMYKEAITRIRNAGINNTLVIDPFHYGKEYDLISEYGREILEHDPQQNVVFSVHFYNGYGEDQNAIRDAFDSITGQGLPLVIGEFGTHHASGSVTSGNIQEEFIMDLAEEYDIGTYPWAWHGDGHGHSMTYTWEANSISDFTPFGQSVLEHVSSDSEIATIFE